MSAYDVLTKFFDEGSFNEVDALLKTKEGKAEAVAGFGTVDGVTVYAFAQNVDECGGAMSKAQAKKILKVYDLALKTGSPIVGFFDSIGGRIDDKDILNSYGEILNKATTLSGVVPQISVVLGTCLGTSALTAASADFVIMKKDALLSVNTCSCNADAETNAKHGIANFVCDDEAECIEKVQSLLSYLPENNLEQAPIYSECETSGSNECIVCSVIDADSKLVVNKDFADSIGTAFARVNGMSVGIINAKADTIECDAANKIVKMVKFCDAFSIPVITAVNAKEFKCVKAATKVASAYAEATTAKISIVNKQAIGAAYIALCGAGANCDMVYALDGAIVSPVAPLAAAFILDADNMDVPKEQREDKANEFVKANLSAVNAAENGYIDDVVAMADLRAKVQASLETLISKRVSTLPKKHTTV